MMVSSASSRIIKLLAVIFCNSAGTVATDWPAAASPGETVGNHFTAEMLPSRPRTTISALAMGDICSDMRTASPTSIDRKEFG